ncbi:hypothetical protein [Streptomyces sp. CB01881]|uniref:hypothetical protein n=1 Tax=Streptomyces sp. CB01881 TaxID=2078691 RepID=UPI000CDC496C|nr:hypothetical protein [Streptomyces sp. CB01881]AUY53771.1 hypothetical protein C2142_38675 [Streptomyces sp. CB01881]TYC68781.1 hypothetical protein EH183_38670 [Streptomyces sp. CB01881]
MTTPRRPWRPATTLLFALSAAVPLLTGYPAHADPAEPTTDATCVLNAHGAFATAVAPGGVDLPAPNTLAMTGTVSCVDAAGAPLATGAFERTVTMPATECTGDEHGDTSTTNVHWTDQTASAFRFDKIDVVKVNGTASLVITGGVTADSARFADDTINAVGTSTGTGCGTPAGETAVDSTIVLRLAH